MLKLQGLYVHIRVYLLVTILARVLSPLKVLQVVLCDKNYAVLLLSTDSIFLLRQRHLLGPH